MKIKKLALSLLGLFTIFATSGLNGLNYENIDPVQAAMDEKLTDQGYVPVFSWVNGEISPGTMPMNIYDPNGSDGNYFIGQMENLGFVYDEFDEAQQFTAYRDVIYEGEEVLGEYIADLYIDSQDINYSSIENNLVYTQSNTNIYINPNSSADLSLSFTSELPNYLYKVANRIGYDFMMPLFWFENVPAFYIRAYKNSNWCHIYSNNDIIESAICYSNGRESSSSDEHNVNALPELCVLFRLKASTLTKISSIQALTWNCAADLGGTNYKINSGNQYDYTRYLIAPYCESQQLHIKVINNAQIIPAEIKSLDIENGNFVLDHFLTHRKYGVADTKWYLNEISMTVYSNYNNNPNYVAPEVTYTLNTKTQYEQYLNTHEVVPYRFYYGPRFLKENELIKNTTVDEDTGKEIVTTTMPDGTGGLIYGYQLQAGAAVRPSVSSVITITKMSFYQTNDEDDVFEFYSELNNPVITTVRFTDDTYHFKYQADKATALIRLHMYERQEKDLATVSYSPTTATYVVGNILLPGAVNVFLWLGCAIATLANSDNYNTNIQRFYFNFYDRMAASDIPLTKIKQLEFSYQLGDAERIVSGYEWIDANDRSKGFRGQQLLPIPELGTPLTKRVTSTYNSQEQIYNTVFHQVDGLGFVETRELEDCFVDISDDCIQMENGIFYSYFYQHLYHTYRDDDDKVRSKDWMVYFSPLSIWYETTAGETIRGTTHQDGLYLAYDENGKPQVYDIYSETPDEPTGISPETFLNTPKTDVVIDHGDTGPEENTVTQIINDIKNWFTSVGGAMGTFFKILAIIAIVIIVIILLVLIIRFIRWIYRSLSDDRGGHRRN